MSVVTTWFKVRRTRLSLYDGKVEDKILFSLSVFLQCDIPLVVGGTV